MPRLFCIDIATSVSQTTGIPFVKISSITYPWPHAWFHSYYRMNGSGHHENDIWIIRGHKLCGLQYSWRWGIVRFMVFCIRWYWSWAWHVCILGHITEILIYILDLIISVFIVLNSTHYDSRINCTPKLIYFYKQLWKWYISLISIYKHTIK